MKMSALIACLVVSTAWGAWADPMAVCTNLTGTFAEPEHADKPVLAVAFTNGQFRVTDPAAKKTFVSATPTELGLVMVEDPEDRNVFRLARIAGTDEYTVEYLGKEGKTAAGGAKQRLIRLGPQGTKKTGGAEAEAGPKKAVRSIPDARWVPGQKSISRTTPDGHLMWTATIAEETATLEEADGAWVVTTVTGKRYGFDIATGRMLWVK